MTKEKLAVWILSGLFTIMSVLAGFAIDKFNTLDKDIDRVYIRQATQNQRWEDEGMYNELKEKYKQQQWEIDSLRILIKKLQ